MSDTDSRRSEESNIPTSHQSHVSLHTDLNLDNEIQQDETSRKKKLSKKTSRHSNEFQKLKKMSHCSSNTKITHEKKTTKENKNCSIFKFDIETFKNTEETEASELDALSSLPETSKRKERKTSNQIISIIKNINKFTEDFDPITAQIAVFKEVLYRLEHQYLRIISSKIIDNIMIKLHRVRLSDSCILKVLKRILEVKIQITSSVLNIRETVKFFNIYYQIRDEDTHNDNRRLQCQVSKDKLFVLFSHYVENWILNLHEFLTHKQAMVRFNLTHTQDQILENRDNYALISFLYRNQADPSVRNLLMIISTLDDEDNIMQLI